MTRSSGFMAMAMVFFAAAIIIPGLASRDIAPSPSDDDEDLDYPFDEPANSPEVDYEVPEEYANFAAAPAPELEAELGYYRYLQSCVEVIPEDCGKPIVDAIYKNSPVDGRCCHKLVEMGKDCHLALVKAVGLIDKNKSHADTISQRGLQLWNQCVNVSPSSSP